MKEYDRGFIQGFKAGIEISSVLIGIELRKLRGIRKDVLNMYKKWKEENE